MSRHFAAILCLSVPALAVQAAPQTRATEFRRDRQRHFERAYSADGGARWEDDRIAVDSRH
jgi:hypothetical protein